MLPFAYYYGPHCIAIITLIIVLRLRRKQKMFADSLATLSSDVQKLIAEGGPAAVAAAVAAKDASDAAAVDALDVVVKAALVPPAPAA